MEPIEKKFQYAHKGRNPIFFHYDCQKKNSIKIDVKLLINKIFISFHLIIIIMIIIDPKH